MGRPCSISDCERPAVARTWCRPHWKHWRRWGDPEFFQTVKPRKSPEDRFWAKVDKRGDSGCWEWQASRSALGYGYFRMSMDEWMWLAHRASWVFANGPIPTGMLVCHHCDNPPCVNPMHLFLGLDRDNTADRVRKGRSSRRGAPAGEANGSAKLTSEDVRQMRSLYTPGFVSFRELGERYGVSAGQARRVVRGLRWKHLA